MSTFMWWANRVCVAPFRGELNKTLQRLRIARRAPMLLLPVAAILVGSCSDTTGPGKGLLSISVQVLGDDQDDDGFMVTIDSGPSHFLDRSIKRFADSVSSGEHVIAIDGVADNCVLDGAKSRVIQVERGGTADISFTATCAFTGIRVTTRTTGSDQPPAYKLSIDETPGLGLIPSNGAALFSRLVPGRHTVRVTSVSGNCSPKDPAPALVDVSNRTVADIAFEFACGRADNRIAFQLDSVAGRFVGQYVVISNADAPGTSTVAEGYSPTWSPEGARIVYSNTTCDDYYGFCAGQLLIVNLTTGLSTPIENSNRGMSPAWSPDGATFAFARAPRNGQGVPTLGLVATDGTLPVTLLTPDIVDVAHPSWSPDSQRIVFQCGYTAVPRTLLEICVINRDGTGLVRLTNNGINDGSPSWSPDGSLIAFSQDFDVAVMSPDGNNVRLITRGLSPSWLPNGSKILFEGGQPNGLFVISLDGSNLTRLTTGAHHLPVWRK